jgi:hypothetical protein
MDGDYEHRGSAVEHHASPIKEIYVSDEFKPEKNPFRGTADAKEVYHPPSPSFFESSNSDEAPPLPAVNLLSNSNNRHMSNPIFIVFINRQGRRPMNQEGGCFLD